MGDSEVITIPVTVTDDQGATDMSQIQITVSGTNDAPVAGDRLPACVVAMKKGETLGDVYGAGDTATDERIGVPPRCT